MELINFSDLPIRKKSYGGANGNKICVVIDDELYMLKLPSRAKHNQNLSYANSSVSEYLGCHIFNMLGIKAQETVLGHFTYKDVTRVCVACKDFEIDGYKLMDFASVKNQIIDSESNGYGTELKEVIKTIEEQNVVDPIVLSNYFWDIFVIDALIGNWDRHNGNWGFLYKQETDEAILAPIFDCGSCLYPQMDENLAVKILKDNKEMEARVYDIPTSAIIDDNKRINYYEFIQSRKYSQCEKAISRLKQKIDMNQINEIIDSVDCIGENYRNFLKKIIKMRYDILFNGID